MNSDNISSAPPSRFYATEIYVEEFDFTVVDDSNPLPSLVPAIERVAKTLMSCVAALAVSGTVTLSATCLQHSDLSNPAQTVVYEPGEGLAGEGEAPIRLMTARMLERAKLATRVFARTPHPGETESDPDYGI